MARAGSTGTYRASGRAKLKARRRSVGASCVGWPPSGPASLSETAGRAVCRVAALLKRWLLGTHKGADKREHLNHYLDEFTFRFNRRTSRSHGLLFYRLLQQAAVTAPVPFRTMIARASLVASANSVANSTHA